jgi:hypothetical protein
MEEEEPVGMDAESRDLLTTGTGELVSLLAMPNLRGQDAMEDDTH